MDWIMQKKDLLIILKKYRFTAIVILLGILLILLPEKTVTDRKLTQTEQAEEILDFQTELEDILSKIAGAGDVKVLLSEAAGQATLYQTDTHTGSSNIRESTVLVTNAEREECGLIVQTNPPVYQGAVVLCQGADKATIRLSIVEAVKSATGLTSDCITVLKMK